MARSPNELIGKPLAELLAATLTLQKENVIVCETELRNLGFQICWRIV